MIDLQRADYFRRCKPESFHTIVAAARRLVAAARRTVAATDYMRNAAVATDTVEVLTCSAEAGTDSSRRCALGKLSMG